MNSGDRPRFLGIDFGWEGKPTGLAALELRSGRLTLLDLSRESSLEDILSWVDRFAADTTGIGVDAPLVIPNASGMRDADKLAHRHYGKYHAGCYPASRERGYWRNTTGISEALADRGFKHGDRLTARQTGRFQIEVHPHAATVQLYSLPRIVKYKRGKLAERQAGLRQLRDLMWEHLRKLTPPLALPTPPPEIPGKGTNLKSLEDRLDAITSAYVAAHHWYWGSARNNVLGDRERGYIVVPNRIADLRENYTKGGLSESDMHPDPVVQFDFWFTQAREAGLKEPNAMTLATASKDGIPSARVVLLKDFDENGFVFFTNYESQKGRELVENPKASLVFYWADLERQVRISGSVTQVSREESEVYFHSRPVGSQLGAWTSHQSEVIPDRNVLEARLADLEKEFAGKQVPLPPFWGGFRVRHTAIEFWQGRPSRLHDRLLYTLQPDGVWRIERLSP